MRGPSLLHMEGKPHQYEIEILERHLDTFGHVNNAKYLEIFEEARWNLITHNGYGLDEIKVTNQGPIILGVTVKFKKELRLREKIRVSTSVIRYDRKVGIIRQILTNSAGEVSAEADFTFGLFDTIARKLIAPTEKWKRAIGYPR